MPCAFAVELAAGHEIVFVPLMPNWHNATMTTIEGLVVQQQLFSLPNASQ